MTSYGMNAVLQPFVDDVKKLVCVLADVLLIHVIKCRPPSACTVGYQLSAKIMVVDS